jgi:TPR repeat protein
MKEIGGVVLALAVLGVGCGSDAPSPEQGAESGTAAFERRDFEKAFELLEPIAQQGDADAQFRVGFMYLHGRGVKRDFAEAMRWLGQAADQGHAEAQYNLALNYAGGRGTAEDAVQAHVWASLAAQQGYRAAGELKDNLTQSMTEDQLRESRKRISEWRVSR